MPAHDSSNSSTKPQRPEDGADKTQASTKPSTAGLAAAQTPAPAPSEVIDVTYRMRVPHFGARKRRVVEFEEVVATAMRQRAERDGESEPSDEEIAYAIDDLRSEASCRRIDIQAALESVAPVVVAKPAKEVDRKVEVAAILRLPVLIYAFFRLILYTKGPKFVPVWRRMAVATGMHMGFSSVRPNAARELEDFCRADAMRAWMHLWPGEPPTYRPKEGRWELSAFYKQLKKVFGTRNSWKLWQAVNRDILLELLGEHTVDETKGGSFANVADALKYILVDGFLIEANLPQQKPVSEAMEKLMRGENRSRCGFVIYSRDGQVTRRCHGYKWMQLSLLKVSGAVIHGRLFPANVDEREATLQLLEEAFRLWPELKVQKDIVLVGDALYDQSEQFAYELTFRFGIHPCFPRAGTISSKYPHHDTGGVPRCECGELAVLAEAANFPTPFYRHKRRLAGPGDYLRNKRGDVIDDARLRWRCAKVDRGQRCAGAPDTYPRENPRLYTYLPHAGNHSRAALRLALATYRNAIESSFSALKDMGLAGKGQERPFWAGDDQMDHLVWMAVTTLAARRLVHENGLYDSVYSQAKDCGLLTAPTLTNMTPGPTSLTPDEARDWARQLTEAAKAPQGEAELDIDSDEFVGLVYRT